MSSRRITLAPAEKFDLWGSRIVQITLPKDEPLTWDTFVSVRSSRGFVGSITPGQSAEVTNALMSRHLL